MTTAVNAGNSCESFPLLVRALKAVNNLELLPKLLTAFNWPWSRAWLQYSPLFRSVLVFRMGDRISCWNQRKLPLLDIFSSSLVRAVKQCVFSYRKAAKWNLFEFKGRNARVTAMFLMKRRLSEVSLKVGETNLQLRVIFQDLTFSKVEILRQISPKVWNLIISNLH